MEVYLVNIPVRTHVMWSGTPYWLGMQSITYSNSIDGDEYLSDQSVL